jgi:hypothetical protein
VPDVDLYAFDMDSESRRQLLRLWKLNGCPGKLTVGELLSFEGLMNLGAPGTLLICDIEGGEMELLNPLHCAALYKMDILVEVHRTGGCSVEENAASLLKRFSQSHMIESLPPSQVTEGLCGVSNLDENLLRQALSEGRPYPQVWLWMKASTLNT